MLDVDELERRLARRPRQTLHIEGFRPAAVLVPILVEPERRERLAFIERPSSARAHAGQVAFPGGRAEPEDRDATTTALRETEEELGIPPSSVRVLGTLDDLATPSGYLVTPVVGVVAGPVTLVPSPAEVARVFLAELDELRRPDRYQFDGDRDFLGIRYALHSYRWDEWRIWGATGRMVHQLFQLLDGE